MGQRNEGEPHYDEVEKWCLESIHRGKDFLFDPLLFRQALEETSTKYNFAFEVSTITSQQRSEEGIRKVRSLNHGCAPVDRSPFIRLFGTFICITSRSLLQKSSVL